MAKEWTIMVYLAGNNNLAEEMVFAVREMLRIGSREHFDIVVQLDSGRTPRRIGPLDFNAVSRTEREREDQPLDILGEPADPHLTPTVTALTNFIDFAVERAPANHYMLVLSGHGSGAVGDFLAGDIESLNLSIPQLREVMAHFQGKNKGEKIDILGLDSCLMSMAEVACEVAPFVKYMIGAEGFEANTGWPYSRLLEVFIEGEKQPGGLQADALSKRIVDEYTRYYFNFTIADRSTDIAFVDLYQFEKFMTAMRRLAKTMREKLEELGDDPDPVRDAMVLAHWEAQSYKGEQYTDIWDFCNLLAIRSKYAKSVYRNQRQKDFERLESECEAVRDAVSDCQGNGLVKAGWYNGAAFQYSRGLSVYFPWRNIVNENGVSDLDMYSRLRFAEGQESPEWHAFLEMYVRKTQRAPRDESKKGKLIFKKNGESVRRTSQINLRQGVFTAVGTLGHKDTAPEDRDTAPEDRIGFGIRIGDTKNVPVDWFPADLFTERWTETGEIETKDPKR
jgi:hypothetical protein